MTLTTLAVSCLVSVSLWAVLILTAPYVLFFFVFGIGVLIWEAWKPREDFTGKDFEDHGRDRL